MNTTLRTRTRTMKNAGWLAVAGLVGAALVAPAGVAASKPAPEHKVAICQATNADGNPYLLIEVDVASVGAGHGTPNDGPVWSAGLKDLHLKWGDIVPPFDIAGVTYAGYNWTADGIAIYQDDCVTAAAQTSEPTGTPAATETPEATETPDATGTPDATETPEATETPDATGTPDATDTPEATETPTGDVDGETGAPSSDPSGGVEGATGTPKVTLPPTDTLGDATGSAPANGTLRLVLFAMAGLLGTMLLVGREPAARRR